MTDLDARSVKPAETRVEYRLSFESPDPWRVAAVEQRHGKNVWPRYPWENLGEWHRTEVVFHDDERMDQYETLRRWAETREEPIRNVTLERREVPLADAGWGPA